MKIAHVCPFSPSRVIGGVARVVWELATRQVKAGHDVSIITSDWDKTKRIEIKEEVVEGIKIIYCYHYVRIGDFSSVWPSIYNKLIKLRPDIIHTHISGHLHSYLAMKAAKKLGVPLMMTTHCPWESKRSFIGALANQVSYKIFPTLRYASSIIAITPWEYKFLLKEGVKKENIYTIPNGMDKMFFKKIEPNNFKEKHNIPLDHKVVLFFGRLNVTKNPQMFIEIADAILRERKDTTFVICGPDEGELSKVKEKIANLYPRVKKNIRLLPPIKDRKDIVEMYQASDIYLLPSRREGAPLTQKEAYASGLPVVASSVNGVPYELTGGVNGFLLDPIDIGGFIEKVNLLLDDELLRLSMFANNTKKAKAYDWDLIAKRTMDLYKATTL